MEENIKEQILSDLRGAQQMIGQAMQRLHPSLDIFKMLQKEIDQPLDSIIEGIEEGDFDK